MEKSLLKNHREYLIMHVDEEHSNNMVQGVRKDPSKKESTEQRGSKKHPRRDIDEKTRAQTENAAHTDNMTRKGTNEKDETESDWEMVENVPDSENTAGQPCGGYTGHFGIAVGWGQQKHWLYSSDWRFGQHHHHHDCNQDDGFDGNDASRDEGGHGG
ncbi:hypothetical protein BJX65DRAFT_36869 [Aspergillus insuetus]